MKRKLISLVLVLVMSMSLSAPALASDATMPIGTTVEIPIYEPLATDQISPMAHDMEYKSELVGTITKTKVSIGPAGGQPANGSVLPAGSSFIWNDGGYDTSVSISITWGVFSVSVSPGHIGDSTGCSVPALANKACKLYVYKDITTYKYAEYERLIGTSTWRLTGYRYGHAATKLYLEVKAV
jgi:hypothetical protein